VAAEGAGDFAENGEAAGDDGGTHVGQDTRERLVDILLENRIPTSVDQQTKKRLVSLGAYILPGMALVVLFGYLIISSRRGTGLFKVRSGARKVEHRPGGVSFADVAGQDSAVAEKRRGPTLANGTITNSMSALEAIRLARHVGRRSWPPVGIKWWIPRLVLAGERLERPQACLPARLRSGKSNSASRASRASSPAPEGPRALVLGS